MTVCEPGMRGGARSRSATPLGFVACWALVLGVADPLSASPAHPVADEWLRGHVTWAGAEGAWAAVLPRLAGAIGGRLVAPLADERSGTVTLGQFAGSRGELLRRAADAAGWEVALRGDLVAFTPEEGIPGGVVGITTAMRAAGKELLLRLLEVLDEDQRAALRRGTALAAADFTKQQQDALLALVRDAYGEQERAQVIAKSLASTTVHISLYPMAWIAPEGSPGDTPLSIEIGLGDVRPGALVLDPATNTLRRPGAPARLGRAPADRPASGLGAKGTLDYRALEMPGLRPSAVPLQPTLELKREEYRITELVELAAQAARREITVDARYGAMRCFVSRGTYDISGILSALCWAFGLEAREVGPILHLGPGELRGLARTLERGNVALLKRIHQALGAKPADAAVQAEASVLTTDLFEEPGTRRRLSELSPEQRLFIERSVPPETQLLLGDAEVAFLLGIWVVVDPHVEREVESLSTMIDERGRVVPLKRIERYRAIWTTF